MAIGESLKLYWLYVKLSVRAQLQYRAAFLLAALGQFLITGIEFLGVWALFDRFGRLHSWSLPEVAVFYGLVNCTFACADALSRGFDQFGALYIKTGHFDRLLLRPRSTILQLAGHELALRRIGRFVQGLIVLVWAASVLNVEWSFGTREFGALYDPRWGLFVLWAHYHASDAGVLDHRNPRNHEYVNLRGCGVCPISHGHLPRCLSPFLYLCGAAGVRQLFPRGGDIGDR